MLKGEDHKQCHRKKPGWYVMDAGPKCDQQFMVYINRPFKTREEAEQVRMDLLVPYHEGNHWHKRLFVKEYKKNEVATTKMKLAQLAGE